MRLITVSLQGKSMEKPSKKYLYRIISFEYLINLFETSELYLSHPSGWEDPYEEKLSHPSIENVYAQCWCKRGVSDAMWRIYSPNNIGVRIKTTNDILEEQIRNYSYINKNIKFKVRSVEYLPQKKIDIKLKQLSENNKQFDIMDALFYKRLAFKHEEEKRLVVY